MLARPGIEYERENSRYRFKQDGEEDQSDMWGDMTHTEGIEEDARELAIGIGGEAEEEKDHGGLDDAGDQALFDMAALEVADFVSQHTEELRGAALIDQGIEKRDFLAFAQAGEKRIGLARAFRAVHDEDAVERESAAFAEGFDCVLQFALGHRGELVEQRHDQRGCEPGEQELDGSDDNPCPEPGVVDALENPQDGGREGQADDGCQQQGFEPIDNEGGFGRSVEAEFFLNDEGFVGREWDADEGLADK